MLLYYRLFGSGCQCGLDYEHFADLLSHVADRSNADLARYCWDCVDSGHGGGR